MVMVRLFLWFISAPRLESSRTHQLQMQVLWFLVHIRDRYVSAFVLFHISLFRTLTKAKPPKHQPRNFVNLVRWLTEQPDTSPHRSFPCKPICSKNQNFLPAKEFCSNDKRPKNQITSGNSIVFWTVVVHCATITRTRMFLKRVVGRNDCKKYLPRFKVGETFLPLSLSSLLSWGRSHDTGKLLIGFIIINLQCH